MFNIVRNIFSKKTKPKRWVKPTTFVDTLSKERLDELYSYSSPPREVGMPIYSVDELLVPQEKLITEISYVATMDAETFERNIVSIIKNFTKQVALLPASANYHHSDPSGLLRHSLETAYFAFKKADSKTFSGQENSEKRRYLEPKWKMACFIAGLLHDIAKTVTDLEVYDKTGELRWQPLNMSLIDWCEVNELDRYYYVWNPNREHNEHVLFNGSFWKSMIPQHIVDDLTFYDNKILQKLLESLGHSGKKDEENIIAEIVLEADKLSVEKNRAGSADLFNKHTLNIKLEENIINAIKDMLQKKWKVNCPGARVWVDDKGVFVVWHAAYAEIRSHLIGTGAVKGIPKDPDSVADLLVGSGLIDEFVSEAGILNRYWTIEPQIEGFNATKMTALKFMNAEMIFGKKIPERIKINFPNIKTKKEPKEKTKKKNTTRETKVKESEQNDLFDNEDKEIIVEKTEATENKSISYFSGKKMIGEFIINLAEDIVNKTFIHQKDYMITEDNLYAFQVPNVITQYGFDKNSILSSLLNESWLEIYDPAKPNLKTTMLKMGQKETKVFILNRMISDKFKQLLDFSSEEEKEPGTIKASNETEIEKKQIKNDEPVKESKKPVEQKVGQQEFDMGEQVENEVNTIDVILKMLAEGGNVPAWIEGDKLYIEHQKIYKWLADELGTTIDMTKAKKELVMSKNRVKDKNKSGLPVVNGKACIIIRIE